MIRQTRWKQRDSIPANRQARGAGWHFWYRTLAVIGLSLLCGCATASQVQYFEVVREDPDTGQLETNYYRMTIEGGTLGAVVYKLKAAYLNAVAVDVLEGKGVFVPEADLPRAADEAFKETVQHYYDANRKRSADVADQAVTKGLGREEYEDKAVELARLVWLNSLSVGDIASVGQTQDLNPYIFRKLVFYATAKNIDLERRFGPQIDSIISKVETLARREQARADTRNEFLDGASTLFNTAPGLDPNVRNAANMLIRLFGGGGGNTPSAGEASGGGAEDPGTSGQGGVPTPAGQPGEGSGDDD